MVWCIRDSISNSQVMMKRKHLIFNGTSDNINNLKLFHLNRGLTGESTSKNHHQGLPPLLRSLQPLGRPLLGWDREALLPGGEGVPQCGQRGPCGAPSGETSVLTLVLLWPPPPNLCFPVAYYRWHTDDSDGDESWIECLLCVTHPPALIRNTRDM